MLLIFKSANWDYLLKPVLQIAITTPALIVPKNVAANNRSTYVNNVHKET